MYGSMYETKGRGGQKKLPIGGRFRKKSTCPKFSGGVSGNSTPGSGEIAPREVDLKFGVLVEILGAVITRRAASILNRPL